MTFHEFSKTYETAVSCGLVHNLVEYFDLMCKFPRRADFINHVYEKSVEVGICA